MAQIIEIKRCVKELIKNNPGIEWTVRQMYYRLVSPPYQIIPITRSAYVSFDKQLVTLRERREIDDDVFVDTARRIDGGDYTNWEIDEYFKNVIERIKSHASFYTRSYWQDQDYNLIVVLEKDALSRLVQRATDKYHIPLAVGRGYSSRTQILQILEKMNNSEKKHIILYLGDFDPTGLDIERSLEERLRNETDWDFKVKRIGLTYQQAKDLPPNPTKMADTRTSDYVNKYGNQCWELDALEPKILQDLVRTKIKDYINIANWEDVEREEIEGQKELMGRFRRAYDLVIDEFGLSKEE